MNSRNVITLCKYAKNKKFLNFDLKILVDKIIFFIWIIIRALIKNFIKRKENNVEPMAKLIIIDKSLTMMPFYHPFLNFSDAYYNLQNTPTIIPYNSLHNLYAFSNINYLKP